VILCIIAITPPVSGFELTIYNAYPLYFWYLFIVTLTCGIGILIHGALSIHKSKWWIAGLAIVILSNSIILALPYFRGYGFFPQGDAMTHAGMIKDIIVTGHIGPNNFYPVVHIIGVNLLYITGLSITTVINIIIVISYFLYITGVYILAKIISNNHGQALMITAFACPLAFSIAHTLIHPAIVSIFMVPFLIYFNERMNNNDRRLECTISLIILSFLITFMHPVTCIFVIILLLFASFPRFLYRKFKNRDKDISDDKLPTYGSYLNVPLIMACVFVLWFFSYAQIHSSIHSVWEFLIGNSGESSYNIQINVLSTASITLFQSVKLFIARYGAISIYLIIAGISTVIVLKDLFKKRKMGQSSVTFSILFLVGLGASIFSFLGFTGENEPWRIDRFALILVPFISGLIIYELVSKRHFKVKIFRSDIVFGLSIITILVVAGGLSIFNIYGSPGTVMINLEVSQMDIQGTKWFSDNQVKDIIVAEGNVVLIRFEDYNYGIVTSTNQRATIDKQAIPTHFGYDLNNSIADTYNDESRYLLLCQADKVNILLLPENVRAKAHDYSENQDYLKLMSDPTVEQVYVNGEFEVWLTGDN